MRQLKILKQIAGVLLVERSDPFAEECVLILKIKVQVIFFHAVHRIVAFNHDVVGGVARHHISDEDGHLFAFGIGHSRLCLRVV